LIEEISGIKNSLGKLKAEQSMLEGQLNELEAFSRKIPDREAELNNEKDHHREDCNCYAICNE